MIFNLSEHNSAANHYIAELRDVAIQTDRMRFRRNLERIGGILGYELSKTLTYTPAEVETPLGTAETTLVASPIVLAAILRAGLPLHQGLLNIFDTADNAFVAAYRKHHKDGTFEIATEYISCPNLDGKVLIVADPMLATGSSIIVALEKLLLNGTPEAVHIVTAIASVYGIEQVQRFVPQAHLWVGAIDEELTAKSYIVPGLGDAGDLAYGEKMQE